MANGTFFRKTSKHFYYSSFTTCYDTSTNVTCFRNTAILALWLCLVSSVRESHSFIPQFISTRSATTTTTTASPLQHFRRRRSSVVLLEASFQQQQQQQQHSSFGRSTAVEIPLLQPLSFDPLLFKSQTPILSKEECEILALWARSQPTLDRTALQKGLDEGEEGANILRRVQTILDAVLNNNNDSNDEIVMPRYLSYTYNDDDEIMDKRSPHLLQEFGVDDLLPDGLHVDTNDGKYLRHWTVLLYLNSCQHLGATTFPLATTTSSFNSHSIVSINHDQPSDQNDEVNRAAKFLIDENVYHTRQLNANQNQLMIGSILDKAALDLFININNHNCPMKDTMMQQQQQQRNYGVRVMPEYGCFSLFSGLQKNGVANPKSFHGGEVMFVGEHKEVLTFFYEISPNGITNLNELGEKVEEREKRFLNMHGFFPTG